MALQTASLESQGSGDGVSSILAILEDGITYLGVAYAKSSRLILTCRGTLKVGAPRHSVSLARLISDLPYACPGLS